MTDVLRRSGWLLLAIILTLSVVLMTAVSANAQTVTVPGTVTINDIELDDVDPGLGSKNDPVLDTCDVTLSYFGFNEGELRQSTVIFHNITGTPGSLLEDPTLPQYFNFEGSGDINVLADEVTYPLVLSGPAVEGLGYHVRVVVSMDVTYEPFPSTGNVKYKTFWIPAECEEEVPVVPPVTPPATPQTPAGVVASATTTTTTATPASLPATGSSDAIAVATISAVAGLMTVMSIVVKNIFVKLS